MNSIFWLLLTSCFVKEYCFEDRDCPDGSSCQVGSCVEGVECQTAEDCGGPPFECVGSKCILECSDQELICPDGSISVSGAFCIDIYEASRVDATAESPGSDNSIAVSQSGVLPWYSNTEMSQEIASAACEAAGKRLCTTSEWITVCRGEEQTAYSYGNEYDPLICNGIDTFCNCEDGEVYPHCYYDCGANFHAEPTATFKDCTNNFGIFDINGNVWELVSTDDGKDHYRGGAYNCSDSERLHACSYDGVANGSFPSARGFRCCADGERVDK